MNQPTRFRECDRCGRRYHYQRTPTRYCGGACRIAAFRQRQAQLAVEAQHVPFGAPLPHGYIPRRER